MLGVYGILDTTNGFPNATFTVSSNAVAETRLNQTGSIPQFAETNMAMTHVELFTSGRLVTSDYNMTIKVDGVSPTGAAFYLDFLTVQVPDSVTEPIAKVIVDDEDLQWYFTGDWERVTRPGNYLNTVHRNRNAGGSAILEFQGTEITVLGTLVGLYSDTKPIGYVQIDDGTNHTIMASDIPNETALNDGSPLRAQQLFSTSGLANAQHTLTFFVPWNPTTPSTSANPSNPPLFIDCAIYGPAPARFAAAADPTAASTPTPSSSSSPSGPPIGAIVGGVVGALVALGAILAGFLFWRRKRGKSLVAEAAVSTEFRLDSPKTEATPYQTDESPSRTPLMVRQMSMHKPMAQGGLLPMAGRGNGQDESLVGGSATTAPLTSAGSTRHGRLTSSGGTDSMTEITTPPEQHREGNTPAGKRRRRRERDGGVRLVPDSDGEEGETLPPRYSRYDS